MGPLEILQTRGVEAVGRYYGTYRALVVNNDDGIGQGKILVTIPIIQTGIQVWAFPKSIGGGLGYGFKYLMPPKGEFVWVEFEYGDPSRPIWSYHPWARGEMPEELASPNVIGLVTPKGHYIVLNEAAEDDEDIITIQLEEGTSIRIGLDKFTLEIPEGSKVEITKDEILFNGGELGGLVKLKELEENLNQLKDYVETMKSAISSGLTAVGVSTAASGPTGATKFNTDMATAMINFKDMENTQVKQ